MPVRSRHKLPLLLCAAGVMVTLASCRSTSNTNATSTTSAPPTSSTASETTVATTARSTTSSGSTSPTTGTDSSSTTEAAAAKPVCELITQADAEKAFGQPAIAGDQSTDECWWATANDLKTINVIRRTPDLDEWRQGLQNDSWTPVSIGDEGYQGKVFDSIVFRVGGTVYEVNVVYSTAGEPEAVVEELAPLVASRL
jgi:hypothetical protein